MARMSAAAASARVAITFVDQHASETAHVDSGEGPVGAAAFHTTATNYHTPSSSASPAQAHRQRARQVERREERRLRERRGLLLQQSQRSHQEEEEDQRRRYRWDQRQQEGGRPSADFSAGGRLPPPSLRGVPTGIRRAGGGAGADADADDAIVTDYAHGGAGAGGVGGGCRRRRGFLLRRMDERKASAAVALPLDLDGATTGTGTSHHDRCNDGGGGGASPCRSVREVIDAFNNHHQATNSSVNVSALSVGSCFDGDMSFRGEEGEHCDDDDDCTVRTPVSMLVNRFERVSPVAESPAPIAASPAAVGDERAMRKDNEEDWTEDGNSLRLHRWDHRDRRRVGRDSAWRRRQSEWAHRHPRKPWEEESRNEGRGHERQQQKWEPSKSKGASSLRSPTPPRPLPPPVHRDVEASEKSPTLHQTRKQQGTTTNGSSSRRQGWQTRQRQLHQYRQHQRRPQQEEGTTSHQQAPQKQSAKDFWMARASRVQGGGDGGGLPNREAEWSGGHRRGGSVGGGRNGDPDGTCSSSSGGSSSGTCSGGAYDFSSVCTPSPLQPGDDGGGSRHEMMGRPVTDDEGGGDEACRDGSEDDGEDEGVVSAPRAISSSALPPATVDRGGFEGGASSFSMGPRSDDHSSEMYDAGQGQAGQSLSSTTQSSIRTRGKHDVGRRNCVALDAEAGGATTAIAPSLPSAPQAPANVGAGAVAVVADKATAEIAAAEETEESTTILQSLPLPFRPRFFRASAMSDIARVAAATANTSSSMTTTTLRVVTPPPPEQPRSVATTGNGAREGVAAGNRGATDRHCGHNRLADGSGSKDENDGNEDCGEDHGEDLEEMGVDADGEKEEGDPIGLGGQGRKSGICGAAASTMAAAAASVAMTESRTGITATDDEGFLEGIDARSQSLGEKSLRSHGEAPTKTTSLPAGDTSAPEDECDTRIPKPRGRTNLVARWEATTQAQEQPLLSTKSDTGTKDPGVEPKCRSNVGKMIGCVSFRQRYKDNLHARPSSFRTGEPTHSHAVLHVATASRTASEGDSAETKEKQGTIRSHSTSKDRDIKAGIPRLRLEQPVQATVDSAKRGDVERRGGGSFRQRYGQYLCTPSLWQEERPSSLSSSRSPITAVVQPPPILSRQLRPPPSFRCTEEIGTACDTSIDSSRRESTYSDGVESDSRDNGDPVCHDSSSPSTIPSVLQQSPIVSMSARHPVSLQSKGESGADCDNSIDSTHHERNDNKSGEIDGESSDVVEIEIGCEQDSTELDCTVVIVPQNLDEIEMEVLETAAHLNDNLQVQNEPFSCDTSRISTLNESDPNHSTEKENDHSSDVVSSQNSSPLSPTAALSNSNRELTNEKATCSDRGDANCESRSSPLCAPLHRPPLIPTLPRLLSTTVERDSLDAGMAVKLMLSPPVPDPLTNPSTRSYEAQQQPHGDKHTIEGIGNDEGYGIEWQRGDNITHAQEASGRHLFVSKNEQVCISERPGLDKTGEEANHNLSLEGTDVGSGNMTTKDLSTKNENDGKTRAVENVDTPQKTDADEMLRPKRVTFSPVEQRISFEKCDAREGNDSVADDYSFGESDTDSFETDLSSLLERDDETEGETNRGGNDDDGSSVGTSVSSLTNLTDAAAYAPMNSTLACFFIPALRCSTCE